MFKKEKKEKKVDLTELEKALKLVCEFNETQIKTLEMVKELQKKQDETFIYCNNLSGGMLYMNDIDSRFGREGEISLQYENKEYSLIANCRNKSLINKSEGIKIIEIGKEGHYKTKYTMLDNLTEKEKKEYEKDGFIIEKIEEK